MLTNFGWKAVLGIIVANTIYFLRFRRELTELRPKPGRGEPEQRSIPNRIIVVHLLFIAWVVLVAHYPILVVLGFLFFVAFVEATRRYQVVTSLRGPLLVGFFLLALVIHGRIEQCGSNRY